VIDWIAYVVAIVIGAMLYAVGYETVRAFIEHVREHGLSFGTRDRVDLSGKWHAVWQTTSKREEVLSTELLTIKQKGRRIVMENLERSAEHKPGGYLWLGEATIFENRHIVGTYVSRERNVTAKGSFYFTLDRLGSFMIGKWVGCNIDYDLTWGFGAIATDKAVAMEQINKLIKNNAPIVNNGGL